MNEPSDSIPVVRCGNVVRHKLWGRAVVLYEKETASPHTQGGRWFAIRLYDQSIRDACEMELEPVANEKYIELHPTQQKILALYQKGVDVSKMRLRDIAREVGVPITSPQQIVHHYDRLVREGLLPERHFRRKHTAP